MDMSIKLANAEKWLLILIFAPIVFVSFVNIVIDVGQQALAQESQQQTSPEELVIRRVEIWGVFYRLMMVAFVVGAVVQGCIVYVCWRFRESNKKNKPREPMERAHR